MKLMRAMLIALAALAAVGFLSTFILEASFQSRSQWIQIVTPDPQGLRHGGLGYLSHGPAQRLVLEDPKALLPGFGSGGVRLADADYLKRHATELVPLSAVKADAWIARFGCLIAIALCVMGARALRLGQP